MTKALSKPFVYTEEGPGTGLKYYIGHSLVSSPIHEPIGLLLHEEGVKRLMSRLCKHFKVELSLPDPIAVEEVVLLDRIRTGDDVKNAQKRVQMLRKKWKKKLQRQVETNDLANQVHKLAQDTSLRVLCIDIEWLEFDASLILEVGWAESLLDEGEWKTCHYIIKENEFYRNGKWVADRKYDFAFGQSILATLDESRKALQDAVDECDILVGHGMQGDLVAISQYLKVEFDEKRIEIIDTAKLYNYKMDPTSHQTISLTNLMHAVGCQYDYNLLHNAGNDAYYSLKAFFKLLNYNKPDIDPPVEKEEDQTKSDMYDDIFG